MIVYKYIFIGCMNVFKTNRIQNIDKTQVMVFVLMVKVNNEIVLLARLSALLLVWVGVNGKEVAN